MRKTSVLAAVGSTLLALSLLVPAVATAESMTVSGEIEVLDEDDDGKVLEIVLVNDDADYYVVREGKGAALFKMVGRHVTVRGETSVDADGMKSIRVQEILKN